MVPEKLPGKLVPTVRTTTTVVLCRNLVRSRPPKQLTVPSCGAAGWSPRGGKGPDILVAVAGLAAAGSLRSMISDYPERNRAQRGRPADPPEPGKSAAGNPPMRQALTRVLTLILVK